MDSTNFYFAHCLSATNSPFNCVVPCRFATTWSSDSRYHTPVRLTPTTGPASLGATLLRDHFGQAIPGARLVRDQDCLTPTLLSSVTSLPAIGLNHWSFSMTPRFATATVRPTLGATLLCDHLGHVTLGATLGCDQDRSTAATPFRHSCRATFGSSTPWYHSVAPTLLLLN